MTIRIGLAGSGQRAAGTYAPALAGYEGVQFAGVWGRTPLATQALAATYDVPAFGHYDDFLEQCDAVAFAVPPPAQANLAATAARRGKALLLETPIAGDLAGAEELVRVGERAGVITQVALTWRFSAAVRRFLDGDVPAVEPAGGRGRLVAPIASTNAWHAERGLLRTGGTDLIDLLDAALGNIAGVTAHGNPGGWVGLFLEHQIGRVSEASLYAGAPQTVRQAEVEVYGPGGAARIDLSDCGGQEDITTMISEFVDALDRNAAPVLDVQHGLHLQNVIEEAESYLLLAG
jgi:predicted dehydrogenase